MSPSRRVLRGSAIVLAWCAALPCAAQDVRVTAAQAAALGIQTYVARVESAPASTAAIARVLDPLPWIRLDGNWRAAVAAERAARAEAARAQALSAAGDAVSRRTLDAAQAALAGAAAALRTAAAERRLGLGASLQDMLDKPSGTSLLEALASGEAQALRIEPVLAADARTRYDGADIAGASVQWLGPAAQASATAQAGYLGIVRGLALAQGAVVPARLTAAAVATGVRVPESAVLRWNGADWVYVMRPPDTYQRQRIALLQRLPDGDWLARGIAADARVVGDGAADLLGAELVPRSADGDAPAAADDD